MEPNVGHGGQRPAGEDPCAKGTPELLPIGEIVIDAGTQVRAEIDEAIVEEYAEYARRSRRPAMRSTRSAGRLSRKLSLRSVSAPALYLDLGTRQLFYSCTKVLHGSVLAESQLLGSLPSNPIIIRQQADQ